MTALSPGRGRLQNVKMFTMKKCQSCQQVNFSSRDLCILLCFRQRNPARLSQRPLHSWPKEPAVWFQSLHHWRKSTHWKEATTHDRILAIVFGINYLKTRCNTPLPPLWWGLSLQRHRNRLKTNQALNSLSNKGSEMHRKAFHSLRTASGFLGWIIT